MKFRWDRTVDGLITAAVMTITAASPLVADGITQQEWYTLGLTFLGTLFAFLKDHKPIEEPKE
jgi:hypothetical protein